MQQWRVAVLAGWMGVTATGVAAQAGQRTEPLPDMSAIARALGVTCAHCHVRGDFASDANPKKGIARRMLEMTREINATVASATGRTGPAAVSCMTCHKGQAVPRTLSETLLRVIAEQGNEAAAAEYRRLRTEYYGRDVFDFGEPEFLNFGMRLAEARPDAALAILAVHLEFSPQASNAYVAMSRAHVRKRDTAAAVAALKKAIEIEPENGLAHGYLAQLSPRR